MFLVRLLVASGAFATPLPWQVETALLMFALLLAYSPRVIDSMRKFRESDHGSDQGHNQDKEDKQHPY
jgi:hypothetical protein